LFVKNVCILHKRIVFLQLTFGHFVIKASNGEHYCQQMFSECPDFHVTFVWFNVSQLTYRQKKSVFAVSALIFKVQMISYSLWGRFSTFHGKATNATELLRYIHILFWSQFWFFFFIFFS